jgi:GC-rich sequence DNA-binding factor-like protein
MFRIVCSEVYASYAHAHSSYHHKHVCKPHSSRCSLLYLLLLLLLLFLVATKQISALLQRVSDTVATAPDTVTPAAVLKAFATMRSAFAEEYAVFGLAQLAPALAAPIIARALKDWKPLAEPQAAAVLFARWRQVLGGDSTSVHDEQQVYMCYIYCLSLYNWQWL